MALAMWPALENGSILLLRHMASIPMLEGLASAACYLDTARGLLEVLNQVPEGKRALRSLP